MNFLGSLFASMLGTVLGLSMITAGYHVYTHNQSVNCCCQKSWCDCGCKRCGDSCKCPVMGKCCNSCKCGDNCCEGECKECK